MLPAIVGLLVVLAVLFLLLAVFRTSKGRKLLITHRIKQRATTYMVDIRPTAEVRENGVQDRHLLARALQAELPDISLPSICATLRIRFPHLKWPELPDTSLHRLDLPKSNLHDCQLEYPDFQWPSTPNLAFLCNLLRIAFPNSEWPALLEYNFDTAGANWVWPNWELPDVSLSAVLAELRARFPHLMWPALPHVQLTSLALPRLSLGEYEAQYPYLSPWPSVPDLFFLLNLLRIAFPELEWPPPPDWSLPEISALELSLPNWGMPDWSELSADLDLSSSFFDSLMVKLRILISMIQVLSQLGVVYSIPFPSIYSNVLRWIGMLELNFIDMLPLGCVMTAGFHFSLLVRTLVLPVLLLVEVGAKLVRAPAKVINVFDTLNFLVLFLIYPSTSAAIFATFQCEELSDGTRWLRADLSIDCSGDMHTLFRYYAGFMVLLYPLGTPLFYLFLLRRNRGRLNKLRVNQALRIQLINNARASGDYQSGRISEDKRQVPWLISAEERTRLSVDVLKDLRELEHEDVTERAALPSSISKLLKGYELRACWFEVFECVRKLAVACLPVFFQPSGSASQLLFGLMVCFVCFGAYVHFDPFEDRGNDAVAQLCQVQIFFSLLSSVALSFSDDENAGSNIDMLLVVLLFLPVMLAVVLESPLKPVVSALMSRLAALQQKKPPVRPESAKPSWRDFDVPESPSGGSTNPRSLSIGQTTSYVI